VPTGNNHWHFNADAEVKLDAPTKTVYVRYVGDPGVNNLRIYAHCIKDEPSASAFVTITHAWRERGQRKTKTVTLDKPGRYEIIADDDPVDEFIEFSVPSSARR
jgi:hypothetical protein